MTRCFSKWLLFLTCLLQTYAGSSAATPSNPVSGQPHEVEINHRRYKFMIPSDWAPYDHTYKGPDSGTLPGSVGVQFNSPAKMFAAKIDFSYRGSVGQEEGALFRRLLQNHTDSAKSENLEPAQINELTHLLGNCVGDNQYRSQRWPHRFNMTSCKIISLNNTPVLSVEGQGPDAFLHLLYLDGSGDGANVDGISLWAPTKAAFEEARPAFDQVLKTLTW